VKDNLLLVKIEHALGDHRGIEADSRRFCIKCQKETDLRLDLVNRTLTKETSSVKKEESSSVLLEVSTTETI